MKFRAHDLKRVTPEGRILEQTSENTKSPDLAPRFQDFDLLADAVVVFNASSGRVAHINAAARTLTTQSAALNQSLTTLQDWTGKSPDFFRPGGHADTFEPQACFRLETLLADCLFEVHVKLHQAADQQDYLTAVFRDIAERSESERMTKELVSTISHELRSPMTAIKGAMGLIVSGAAGELSDKAREMVLIAQRNADRLVLIINDFLDLEKFSDGQMVFDDTPSDLLPVVYDAVEAIAGFQGRFDVTVEIDAQDSDLRSLLDPNRLVQVLVNLLSNAIKFSPPGGVVTIRLAHHQSYNRISVIDRGDGIPDADQKALFGRFVQIGLKNRAATGGTGLGLSIVKAILEHQNGTISVDSTLGQGTTFHVDLPQIAPVEARAHAEGA